MSSRRAYRTEQISGAPHLERPDIGNRQQKGISKGAKQLKEEKGGEEKARANETFNEEVINFLQLLRVQ